jgi:hypothetical protein
VIKKNMWEEIVVIEEAVGFTMTKMDSHFHGNDIRKKRK